MRVGRPIIAAIPASFGKKGVGCAPRPASSATAEDVRLFLTTFVAGFAFVLVMIA